MQISEENKQIAQLNEMFVNVAPHIDKRIEQSIYYPKLKNILHSEIFGFCKEQTELKEDLNLLRMNVGQTLSEKEIREYLDGLKEKYNSVDNNIGLDYHIEQTRIDYGVAVFVIIKRADIMFKKFVFRFKKNNITQGLEGLSVGNVPINNPKED